MGIFDKLAAFDRATRLVSPERKITTTAIVSQAVELPNHSATAVREDIAADKGYGGISAFQISTVFACARVIAEGLAQVPCILQRVSATGGHEPARDHPLYDLLARKPNNWMTALELREWIGFNLALVGNAYIFVSRDTEGRAIELIPLPQGSVTAYSPSFGEVLYQLNDGSQPVYSGQNIWHIKGSSWDAITGLSIQHVAARAIGLAGDLENFGSSLFKNGAQPSGVLSTEQELSPEQAANFKKLWDAQQSGIANAHRTALLGNGMKFQPVQTNANEAQFIEGRRLQIEEICRFMGVDPVMVGQSIGSTSYASVEQKFLAHYTYTLRPLYERFMQSAEVSLLSTAEQKAGYRVYIDARGITLASSTDSAAYYASMRQNGLMTINECREHAGLDRSNDPLADKLQPSANLFGPQPTNTDSAPAD
ncbi:phage portal protein [Sphingomonas sp. NFX23]|uniref:phage portal protein n=1 Tax=Sphingomonas sp. NFX23 TaxID=2819532 RepID=UPI003CF3C051